MRIISCPISQETLRSLYLEEKLTDEVIASRIGLGATVKRVRSWRHRFGIRTISRTERHIVPPIEGGLQSVLVGSMLGDGRIVRVSKSSSRYVENHCDAQKQYLEWKSGYWGSWVQSGVKSTSWILRSKTFPGWRFETVSHASLNPWQELFYSNPGPKQLQGRVVDLVNPLAIAIWFMDDGSAGWWPCITFGMNPNSRSIALSIFNKFGLTPRWQPIRGNTGNWIFEGENQAEHFIELVSRHIPDFMRYKLDFGFQGVGYQLRHQLTKEKLQDLSSQGIPIRRMARVLGEAPTTIDRYLKRHEITHPRVVGMPKK